MDITGVSRKNSLQLLKTVTLTLHNGSVANLNGVTETIPAIPKITNMQKAQKRMKIAGLLGEKPSNLQENSFQTTRRLAIGLASVALIGNSSTDVSLAEDNWWARDINPLLCAFWGE